MEIIPSYQMGLLHQLVWGLAGISYQGDPLNVGGSSTINISSARRKVTNSLWLNVLPTPLIYHLVKAVTWTPSFPHTNLKMVIPHLIDSNKKFHIFINILIHSRRTGVLLAVAIFLDLPWVSYVDMTSGSIVLSRCFITFSLGIWKILGAPWLFKLNQLL